MRSSGGLLRAGALITGAALTLHELRYAVGYGLGSREAAEGHAYLPLAFAIATGLLVLAATQFLALLLRSGRAPAERPSLRWLWLGASAALLAIFVGQELLEGLLAGGHGAAGLVADGGWSAIPLAVGLGALVALVLGGADRALGVARRPAGPRVRPPLAARPGFARTVPPPASVLSRHLASRAPPLLA